jgi:hypothetical protein
MGAIGWRQTERSNLDSAFAKLTKIEYMLRFDAASERAVRDGLRRIVDLTAIEPMALQRGERLTF